MNATTTPTATPGYLVVGPDGPTAITTSWTNANRTADHLTRTTLELHTVRPV